MNDHKQFGESGRLVTRRAFVMQLAGVGLTGSLFAGCAGQPSSSDADSASSNEGFEEAPDDRPKSDSGTLDEKPSAETADSNPHEHHIARIALVSDMHIDAGFEVSIGHAQAAFAALTQFDPAPDAIVINGDITNHGQPEEYDLAQELAAGSGLTFPASFVCAMGNHEQRGYYDDTSPEAFQAQRDLFIERCGLERLYYGLEVNGVHLLLLGPDADPQSWMTVRMSDEQLAWLHDMLEADAKAGRISFVFSHQPLDETVIHTYEGEYAYGALESSSALREVIADYGNAILVTAHTHSPADFFRPDNKGPLFVGDSAVAYLRHDPYLDWTEEGTLYSCGVLADVFGDRIEFLSWDFVNGAPDEAGSYMLESTELPNA